MNPEQSPVNNLKNELVQSAENFLVLFDQFQKNHFQDWLALNEQLYQDEDLALMDLKEFLEIFVQVAKEED